MFDRRFLAEAVAIVAAAVLCAAVANFVAGRERKLAVVGSYPNALKVPEKAPESPFAPSPVLEVATEPTPVATSPAATATAAPATAGPKAGGAGAPSSTPGSSSAVSKPAESESKNLFPPHPDKPWVELSSDDVVELYRRKAIFLDARRTSVFEEGHIAGARSFAVWEADVDAKVKALADEGIDPSAPIVVYCTGGNCEDSHMLADKLYQVGFNNALVYKDGFPDWQKRGQPVAKGASR